MIVEAPPVEASLRNLMKLPATRDVPVFALARATTPASIYSVLFFLFSFTSVVWSVSCLDRKCNLMLRDENVWLELILSLHTLHMNYASSVSICFAVTVVQSDVIERVPEYQVRSSSNDASDSVPFVLR